MTCIRRSYNARREQKEMNRATERLKYITAVVLYGTIGMFVRYVSLPSEAVAFCRGSFGSVFILLFMRFRGMHPDRKALRKNRALLVLSGVLLGFNWIFLFAAYIETTVAIASLCNYMAPLIVVLVSPFVLREKQNAKKMLCVLGAFIGIILVSGVLSGERGNLSGVVLGLLAALCFVGIVICNRKMSGISAYDKAIVQLGVSAATILPYVLIHNRGTSLMPDTRSALIVLMLGIVHTGFAYCLYFSGMATLPVQTVAVLGYIEPVVSVICSVLFLHESLGIAGWIGAALIILSAVASELVGEDAQAAAQAAGEE